MAPSWRVWTAGVSAEELEETWDGKCFLIHLASANPPAAHRMKAIFLEGVVCNK